MISRMAESLDSPQLTVVVNPGFSIGSKYPSETVVVTGSGCNGFGAGTVGTWFGSWLGVYGSDASKRCKSHCHPW